MWYKGDGGISSRRAPQSWSEIVIDVNSQLITWKARYGSVSNSTMSQLPIDSANRTPCDAILTHYLFTKLKMYSRWCRHLEKWRNTVQWNRLRKTFGKYVDVETKLTTIEKYKFTWSLNLHAKPKNVRNALSFFFSSPLPFTLSTPPTLLLQLCHFPESMKALHRGAEKSLTRRTLFSLCVLLSLGRLTRKDSPVFHL